MSSSPQPPDLRALDAQVAEQIMSLRIYSLEWPCWQSGDDGSWHAYGVDDVEGARVCDAKLPVYVDGGYQGVPFLSVVPEFSSDWNAAARILEHFTDREYGKVRVTGSHYHGWHAYICWGPGTDGEGDCGQSVWGATGPEAICAAALACVRQREAVGEKRE